MIRPELAQIARRKIGWFSPALTTLFEEIFELISAVNSISRFLLKSIHTSDQRFSRVVSRFPTSSFLQISPAKRAANACLHQQLFALSSVFYFILRLYSVRPWYGSNLPDPHRSLLSHLVFDCSRDTPSQRALRRLNCSLFYLIGLWKHVQCLIGLWKHINKLLPPLRINKLEFHELSLALNLLTQII